MSLLATLDRFVHVTRLDVLTPHGRRGQGNLRWLPLPVLAALPLSYALMVLPFHWVVAAPFWWEGPWLTFVAGVLFWLSFGAANLMRLFGPRVTWESGVLDERELMLKARAGNVSGFLITLLAIGGCFYGGFASVFGTWMPDGVMEWVYLGLLLEAYALLLPVLVASWLQPEPDEEG